jgi:hypothetical protein
MLRTNLATKPFYNERAVRTGLAVVVLFATALTAFNAAQILSLTRRNTEFSKQAAADEARALELKAQATKVLQSLDKEEVAAVQAAAREANILIDRRAFSWTDLFNRFEETLPDDVRIVAVQPQIDDNGRMLVATSVEARRAEDIYLFIERLEATGAFNGSIPRQTDVREDGLLHSILQGYYVQRAAIEKPPASDPVGGAANASPSNATPSNRSGGAVAPPKQ